MEWKEAEGGRSGEGTEGREAIKRGEKRNRTKR